MAAIFLVGVVTCWKAEADGNPNLYRNGVVQADGNMEGKETRFGVFNSALFATVTTDASCGAVNAMHDSFTPVGGLVRFSTSNSARSSSAAWARVSTAC